MRNGPDEPDTVLKATRVAPAGQNEIERGRSDATQSRWTGRSEREASLLASHRTVRSGRLPSRPEIRRPGRPRASGSAAAAASAAARDGRAKSASASRTPKMVSSPPPTQGPAGAEVLPDPADDRRAERRAAHHDGHVERHHPAAQGGRRLELHGRVGGVEHGERAEADHRAHQRERDVRRHQARPRSRRRRSRGRRRPAAGPGSGPGAPRAARRPGSRPPSPSRGCRTRPRPCRRPRWPSARR